MLFEIILPIIKVAYIEAIMSGSINFNILATTLEIILHKILYKDIGL